MLPKISIIIPHKHTDQNTQALLLNMKMLAENTRSAYELIIDACVPEDPYKVWNRVAHRAQADILVFSNSDVLMAEDWDDYITRLPTLVQPNTIVTGHLIEPGNIGVASVNIAKDFGKVPAVFNRQGFEEFSYKFVCDHPVVKEERGWYMPCAVDREWFLSTGGFDTSEAFPAPSDIKFWERCIHDYNTKLIRVPWMAYHFQAQSQHNRSI